MTYFHKQRLQERAPTTHVDDSGRVCVRCKGYKEWGEYHRQPGGCQDHRSMCRTCRRETRKPRSRGPRVATSRVKYVVKYDPRDFFRKGATLTRYDISSAGGSYGKSALWDEVIVTKMVSGEPTGDYVSIDQRWVLLAKPRPPK